MPWWAITYLVVLALMISVTLIKDYRDKRSVRYILGELASGAIGFLFVYAYFHPETAAALSWLVIPLLAYAIIWDQYALSRMKKSAYADLSDHENEEMDKYSRLFAILFITPCYIAGGLLGWQLVSN